MTVLFSHDLETGTSHGGALPEFTSAAGTVFFVLDKPTLPSAPVVRGNRSFASAGSGEISYYNGNTALTNQGVRTAERMIAGGRSISHVLRQQIGVHVGSYYGCYVEESGGFLRVGIAVFHENALIFNEATGFDIAAVVGDVIHMESSAFGTTISCRVWVNSASRPAAPTIQRTRSDYASGAVAFKRNGTSGGVYAAVDDIVITDTADPDELAYFYAAAPTGTVTIGTITKGSTTATIPFTYSGSDQTGYEYRLDGGAATSAGTSSPLSLTGLTASTPYTVEIRAINGGGSGAWSAVGNFTTTSGVAPTGTVTINTVVVGSTSASVNVSYSGSDHTGFEYRLDGGTALAGGATSPISVGGLTASTSYDIEVRAVNADGPGTWSAVSNFTTTAAAASNSKGRAIMSKTVTKGATSQSFDVLIRDDAGDGLTGLAFNTSGLTAHYRRPGAAPVAISLVTQSVGGAYTSGGFCEISAANMPGLYRLDVPDAAFVTGVDRLYLVLKGAANMEMAPVEIELTGVDLKATVINTNVAQISGDATAADNLEQAFDDTAGAVTWLGVVDQGTAQAATSTTLRLRSAAAFADSELIGAVVQITGGSAGVGQTRIITGYTSSTDTATVDAWTTTPTGTITYRVWASPPQAATVAADLAAIKAVTVKVDTALELDGGVYRYTANALELAPSSGGGGLDAAGVRAAVGLGAANLDTQLSGILADTAEIGAAGAGLTSVLNAIGAVPTAVAIANEVQTRTIAEVTSIAEAGRNAIADSYLNRDMSVGTDSGSDVVRTPRQALYAVRNRWTSISGTYTVYKTNDTTVSWTSTLATDGTAAPIVGSDPA